jgi:hypothetical protein
MEKTVGGKVKQDGQLSRKSSRRFSQHYANPARTCGFFMRNL